MPRGSRKGEHRGNAKERISGGEAPADVMRDAVAKKHPPRTVKSAQALERRLETAQRTFRPAPGDVTQMTPRDVMLDNMHYYMQGCFDWQGYLERALSADPATEDSMKDVEAATVQIERFRRLASDDAYKVAPYIHPRLAAVVVGGNAGESVLDIVQALLDDIDARQRDPRVIEHEAKKND